MGVIRRADHDRVDLAVHLVQQFAEIFVSLRLWVLLESLAGTLLVDIAQRHDVLVSRTADVGCARPPIPMPAMFSFSFGDLLCAQVEIAGGGPNASGDGRGPEHVTAGNQHGHRKGSFAVKSLNASDTFNPEPTATASFLLPQAAFLVDAPTLALIGYCDDFNEARPRLQDTGGRSMFESPQKTAGPGYNRRRRRITTRINR